MELFNRVLKCSGRLVAASAAVLAVMIPLHASAEAASRGLAGGLGYEMSGTPCKAPKTRKTNQVANQAEKMRRKINRYNKCVREFQLGLFADATRIQDAVAEGVTSEQAEILKIKLLAIAERIKQLGGGEEVAHGCSSRTCLQI